MAYYNVLSSKRFANFAVYLGDDGVRKYQTYDRIAEVCLIVKAVKLTIQAFKDALQATFDMQMTTFTENTYPTSITIPEGVTSIGDEAFSECFGLTSIHCKRPTPPIIKVQTFDYHIYSNATLYVPTGALNAYKSASYWKNFQNIVEE